MYLWCGYCIPDRRLRTTIKSECLCELPRLTCWVDSEIETKTILSQGHRSLAMYIPPVQKAYTNYQPILDLVSIPIIDRFWILCLYRLSTDSGSCVYTDYRPILDLVCITQLCSGPAAWSLHWSEGRIHVAMTRKVRWYGFLHYCTYAWYECYYSCARSRR